MSEYQPGSLLTCTSSSFVPGHAGVKGNERTDRLGDMAALQSRDERSEWGSSVDKVEKKDEETAPLEFNDEEISGKKFVNEENKHSSEDRIHEFGKTDQPPESDQTSDKEKSHADTCDADQILDDTNCKTVTDEHIANNYIDNDTNGGGDVCDGDDLGDTESDTPDSEVKCYSNVNTEESTESVRPKVKRKVTFGKANYVHLNCSTPVLPDESVSTTLEAESDISDKSSNMSMLDSQEALRSLGSSVDRVILSSGRALVGGDWYESEQRCPKHRLIDKLSIEQCDLRDKRLLIRVDYDVPMEGGIVSNTKKIEDSLPTIQLALCRGAKSVVLMSHLGRPDGRIVEALSLKPVAYELEKKLRRRVTFLEDCVGPYVEDACADPHRGSVILLENLRFHMEEEGHGLSKTGQKVMATVAQTEHFRASLTCLGDIYVNDAFVLSHKTHSSIIGCAMKLRACGLLMKRELNCFTTLLDNVEKPFLAIVCGAQILDKLLVIENLLDHVTEMFIGGGMAYTFLKILHNVDIGDSPFDQKGIKLVPRIMEHALRNGVIVYLPVDFLVADRYAENAFVKQCTRSEGISPGTIGVDVGNQTTQLLTQVISRSNTIVWSGPPGLFEWDDFSHGSRAVMDAVIQATDRGAKTILVGGDTATCVMKFGAQDKVTHLSAGGGAGLEFLEGKVLPGVFVLSRAPRLKGELNKFRIDQCLFRGRRVIIRVDFNVPLKKGQITNNNKIVATIPTIEHVINNGAKSVVLISHLGYPNGQPVHKYSLKPVAEELERLIGRSIIFVRDCVGAKVEKICAKSRHGSVILLENLRFHIQEEGFCICQDGRKILAEPETVSEFRKSLSKLGDIFINDDFESLHRTHSSTVGIDIGLKAAGLLILKELDIYKQVLWNPPRPFLAILGGSDINRMISLMDNLIDLVDDIIIAGDLAIAFLKILKGESIASSGKERPVAGLLSLMSQKARSNNVKIHLPQDFVAKPNSETGSREEDVRTIDRWIGVDIGQKSRASFSELIARAKTIVWSGSTAASEPDSFSGRTEEIILEEIIQATKNGALTILQNNDTVTLNKLKIEHKVSQVCRESGTAAELLMGHSLPGVAVLDPNPDTVNELLPLKIMGNYNVGICQNVERNQAAATRWIPPYNKKLPPLPTYKKPQPRIKYTGAPPPGTSIPSPYCTCRRIVTPSPSPPLTSRKCETTCPCGDGMQRPTCLPPLSPRTKPRVPVQLETLALMDAHANLTVHINGDSKDIPEEASIQVTVVQGYVPLESPCSRHYKETNGKYVQQYKKNRNLGKCVKSQFKNKIKLASLREDCNLFGLTNFSTNKRTAMSERTTVQCRRLSQM